MRMLYIVMVAGLLTGCAADETLTGEAPNIVGLTVTPETVTVGEQDRVEGDLTFADVDGDVAFIGFELRPEAGMSQRIDDVEVAGAAGITAGQVPFFIIVQALQPGSIDLGVWLIDSEGNESNELVAQLTAESD